MLRLIGGVVVYGMALYGAIQVLERYKGAALIGRRSATGESGGGDGLGDGVAAAAGGAVPTQAG